MTAHEGQHAADGSAPARAVHHVFASVDGIAPLALMDGIRARAVHGDRITFAVIELSPGQSMPEHQHPSEQVGMILRGEYTFTVGGETRVRRPGDLWVIPAGVPHAVEVTGDEGCTVVETFSPPRADWSDVPREAPAAGPWPPR
jgi:quercetin dioxygenase-like cupin family protein